MSEKENKIKDILRDKVKEINDSLFVEIIKDIVIDDSIMLELDLFDFIDGFVITLKALDEIGMDEELFDTLMLKMYYFIKQYFFGTEKNEEVSE